MNADQACTATFNLSAPSTYALNVNKAGVGNGAVTSLPAGINCGPDCSEDYSSGSVVVLIASPDPGALFGGWSGDADCLDGVVTMNADQVCTATFNKVQYLLTTYITPAGNGTVVPDCSGGCLYDSGTVVVLTANEDNGYPFLNWTGCNSPSNNICTMTMNTSRALFAVFDTCRLPVRINYATPVYYSTIQEAYDAAAEGDSIQSRDTVLNEDLVFDLNKTVAISGGYGCNYSAVTGITTVSGSLTIDDGTLTIDNLLLQ
jgi:hypothetical protein